MKRILTGSCAKILMVTREGEGKSIGTCAIAIILNGWIDGIEIINNIHHVVSGQISD